MRRAREARTLAVALLASLLLWNLPFGGVVLYPFKVLATWLHEGSHGLAMLATGAGLDRVMIYRDTSGLAYATGTAGAGAFGASLIATAGYMGTPLWGAALLVSTPNARRARIALLIYAVLLALSLIVVDNEFGQRAVGAIAVAMAACAIALPARARVAFAHFVAAQACVDALLDIRVLFRTTQVINGRELACTETVRTGCSDAHNMASYTFGTTDDWAVWTWASIWLAWSLLILFAALRWQAYRADARSAVKNSGAARASDSGA